MITKVGHLSAPKTIERSIEGKAIRFIVRFQSNGTHKITATWLQNPRVQISVSQFPSLDPNALNAAPAAQQAILAILRENLITYLHRSVLILADSPLTLYNALKATSPSQNLAVSTGVKTALSRLDPLAQAYRTALRSSNLTLLSEACLELGNGYFSLGQLHAALRCYHELLSLGKKLSVFQNKPAFEAAAYSSLGSTYKSLGDAKQAILYYEQALKILRKARDKAGERIVLYNLGTSHKELEELQLAIWYYEKSLLITRQTDNKMAEGAVLNNLGQVHRNLGEMAEAIMYFSQSREIYRQIKDTEGERLAIHNLFIAHRALGDAR